MNYYELLDISPDAPEDTIRAVITKRSVECSRKVGNATTAERKFEIQKMLEEVIEAKGVLLDATQRRRYNEKIALKQDGAMLPPPRNESADSLRSCIYCGEDIAAKAKKCPWCERWQDEPVRDRAPEAETTAHIHAPEPQSRPAESSEPVAAGSPLNLVILVALAAACGLGLLLSRLSAESTARSTSNAGVVRATVSTAPSVGTVEVKAPIAPEATPESEAIAAEMKAFVSVWAQDWASRSPEQYISHYDEAFQGNFEPGGTLFGRDAWYRTKKDFLRHKDWIRIESGVTQQPDTSAEQVSIEVSLDYSSNDYQELRGERLEMVKRNGRWLILREEVLDPR